jgi:hypothetical protein
MDKTLAVGTAKRRRQKFVIIWNISATGALMRRTLPQARRWLCGGVSNYADAMDNRAHENLPAQWQDSANLVLGLWLAISPWILPYVGEGAAWNTRLTGLAIAGVAASALVAYDLGKEWLNLILAIWLIVSPWFLGYSWEGAVFYNQLGVGALVWLATTTKDTGGPPTWR